MPYKSEVAVGKHDCCQNEKEYNENSSKCNDWVVRKAKKKCLMSLELRNAKRKTSCVRET